MSEDLINSATTQEEVAVSAVDQLVGEGKKFNSVEDLAKGKIASDKHIEQLEFEKTQVQEDLSKLAEANESQVTMQDILAKLDANNLHGEQVQTSMTDTARESDISGMVSQAMLQERAQLTAQANRDKVNSEVAAYFKGDLEKAKEHIKSTIAASGLNGTQFSDLSESSAEAALRVLNIQSNNQPTTSVSARADLNAGALSVGSEGTRNKSYYDAKKKEMGFTKFHSDVKLQTQMHEDYATMGTEKWAN